MIKILHLATDEKFISAANFIFEKTFPGSNIFLIVKPPSNPPLKYVKEEKNFEMIVQSKNSIDWILDKSKGFDVMVFHGYDQLKAQLFLKDQNKKKYLWLLWGAEVYNESLLNNSFLGKKTEILSTNLLKLGFKARVVENLKNIYRTIRYRGFSDNVQVNISEAIYNTPNMGILYSEEFDYFKENNVFKSDTNYIPFTYYPLEFIFKDISLKIKGDNILLGNSASFTNNHLEAIDMLSSIDLGNRKVYIPLSYGNARYAKLVIDYGNKKLHNNIKPLEGFLPLQTYNELVANCGIVIMNHYRQQAVGNILASLYLGAKLFLNDTTVYQYLKRIGCFVYLIEEDLKLNGASALNLLTQEQIIHNRQVLKNEISTENIVLRLRESMKESFAL